MVFGRRLNNLGGTANEESIEAKDQRPQSRKQSCAFLDELSDKNSALAKFLFIGTDGWEASQRDDTSDGDNDESKTNNNNEDEMPSVGRNDTGFIALTLEPMHIRNARIIQIFEAYTIFGALFMNCVWILYEWGNSKGYGTVESDGDDIVQRIFECVMAVSLSCIIFLTLFGSFHWIMSILWSSSHEDYVLESLKALGHLHSLLCFTQYTILTGLLLGIYCNLSPHWPETVITLAIAIAVFISGTKITLGLNSAVAPLELYHTPSFFKVGSSSKGLKTRARLRAQELRKRAYRERKKLDPSFPARSDTTRTSSVASLLNTAVLNLGRIDSDISTYEARLEEDWFNQADQLNGMSIEVLSKYMPLRLAGEVHRLLLEAE